MTEEPQAGDVWRYPYLWARQADNGEDSGRKDRPSAVMISIRRKDKSTKIVLLAITSQQPHPNRLAMEVPEIERRRAGLEREKRLWVIVDEHNSDIVEVSWYLDPEARIGAFSPSFRKQLQARFIAALKMRRSQTIDRYGERDSS